MLAGHILYIYGYQITVQHSFWGDPPETLTVDLKDIPDAEAEHEEEHGIV